MILLYWKTMFYPNKTWILVNPVWVERNLNEYTVKQFRIEQFIGIIL